MKSPRLSSARLPLGSALLFTLAACAQTGVQSGALAYPAARACDQVDEYHGVLVSDPYRWMEGDPDDPELHAWIEGENKVTHAYLGAIEERDEIIERLTELWDFERMGVPGKAGERLFFRLNDGLQNQSILYVQDGVNGEPRILLDPNTLSEDGTVALSEAVPSPDGKLLACGLSDGGSDWHTWKFLDVDSGEMLPDVVKWNKFGGAQWIADNAGLVYTRFPTPTEGKELRELNTPASICLHRIGTTQEEDVVLSAPPEEPGIGQWFAIPDSRRAVLVIREEASSDHQELDYISLEGKEIGGGIPLIAGYDAQFNLVGSEGRTLWFRTNLEAPRWRIVAVDLNSPERESWREIVPECAETLTAADTVGGRLVGSYLKDATSEVRIFETDGTLVRVVELPGIGTVRGFSGESDDPMTFFSFTNQVTPHVTYRYDVTSGESVRFHQPELHFNPDDYTVEQVFYKSKDGTKVPMFLAYRKGLERDGENATFLYAYGGFNISITPSYRTNYLAWMERGGLLAIPNIRGGGEYGEAWHRAGTKLQKQNVFDDFIAAAQWLIDGGYTRPEKLAIAGASNGGLLVGACMAQRPELFGAALPAVGVMDMLRYHLFTIGWAWAGDYGTVDDPEEFLALYAYSPLHNLRSGTSYPATMVTTADRDDRVVPAHSFKFAARLQAAHEGDAPVLIRIGTRAGHGAGKPTSKRIEEAADILAFLSHTLGM
jgi:prolyl oligopeptidase